MGKVRVYELAKELGISNKELVQKLQSMGYPVKSHSSTIEDFLVREIKSKIQGGVVEAAAETTSRPTVIRRRKRIVAPATPETPPLETEAPMDFARAAEEETPSEPEVEETVETEAVETAAPVEESVEAVAEEPKEEKAAEAAPELKKVKERPTTQPAKIIAEPKPAPEEAAPPEPEAEAKAEEPAQPEAEEPEEPEVVETAESEAVEETEETVEPPAEKEKEEEPAQPAESVEQPETRTEADPENKTEIKTDEVDIVEAEAVLATEAEPKPKSANRLSKKEKQVEEPARSAKKGKDKVKIKRIEKTTAEPAKIISRPVAPPPPPEPAPPKVSPAPQKARPGGGPPTGRGDRRDAPPARPPRPAVGGAVPPPEPPTGDSKRSKKKKRGRDGAEDSSPARKKGKGRREVIERSDLYESGWNRSGRGKKASKAAKKSRKTEITTPKAIKRRIKVVDAITVADLAKKMGIKAGDIIKTLMKMGVMAHLNQALDFDTATLVATDFGYEVEKGSFDEGKLLPVVEVDEAKKALRPPVVTVMGHVDHGKTSLLDAIRESDIIGGEAGGITQHIGAYHVKVDGGAITFLDTPGHAAFTAMRARGAMVTDIVVLVVAADDGVMQQTREAADHARAAGVPIIVAVNKVDKPEAEPDKIRRELADINLVPEDWGGDTIFVDVSAKQNTGIDSLLEMILLQAEVLELKSAQDGRAQGRIVEARLDKGRGPVATVLVQSGLLRQGDSYVCGVHSGKVRAMFDDAGRKIEEAGPSIPVEIQGIAGVPQAGDEFVVAEDEKYAKQVAEHRQLQQRELELKKTSRLTLENLFDQFNDDIKELNLIVKTDVHGSLEAIADALKRLATDEIKINIISSSTGSITETDIMLAAASNALIIGFNVRPNAKVQDLADQENIQIRFYDVIYKLIDDVKDAMVGLLAPIQQEKVLGRALVLRPFHITKVGMIAGSEVKDGKITRGAMARLLRDDVVQYTGKITSLKREKEDAREVTSGYQCGIGLDNYNDIKEGDIIEAFIIEEIAATLD